MKESIEDGLKHFEALFNFKAKTFMAPAFTWNDEIELVLKKNNIDYLQSMFYQNKVVSDTSQSIVYHYFGQCNKFGQRYLLRNCTFEPFDGIDDPVGRCLKEIEIAFRLNKPATISTHRLNYIGKLDLSHSQKNLRLLNDLIIKILKKWPDTEFVSSPELASLSFN